MDKDVKEIAVMDLAPKRDYVYIDDVIEILAQACVQNPSGFEVYNIGSGVSNSVRDVISTAIEVTGICKPYFETGEIRVGEISDSVADMKKTITRFNVDSLRSLEQGLTDWMLKEFPDVVTTHNDNKCLLTEI